MIDSQSHSIPETVLDQKIVFLNFHKVPWNSFQNSKEERIRRIRVGPILVTRGQHQPEAQSIYSNPCRSTLTRKSATRLQPASPVQPTNLRPKFISAQKPACNPHNPQPSLQPKPTYSNPITNATYELTRTEPRPETPAHDTAHSWLARVDPRFKQPFDLVSLDGSAQIPVATSANSAQFPILVRFLPLLSFQTYFWPQLR